MIPREVLRLALRFLRHRVSAGPSGGRRAAPGVRGRLRSRRASQLRSSAVAIGFSLVPLLLVVHVSDGMIEGIVDRYVELGTAHLQIRSARPGDHDGAIPELALLEAHPAVASVLTEVSGLALAAGPEGERQGVELRGLDPDWLSRDPRAAELLSVEAGDPDLAPGQVMPAAAVAQRLGLEPGSELVLLTVRERAGRQAPRVRRLRVSAIVSSGYQALDAGWVFVSRQDAEFLLEGDQRDTLVRVKLDDRGRISTPLSRGTDPGLPGELQRILGDDVRLLTWYDLSRAQFSGLVQTRRVLLVIMGMLLLVSVTTVASGLLSMTHEHRDDFAILEASGGVRLPAAVMLVSAVVIGIIGGIGGTAVGTLISLGINGIIGGLDWLVTALGVQAGIGRELYLAEIPVRVGAWDLVWPTLLSVGVGAFASLVPIQRHRRQPLSARLRASRSA